MDDVVEYINKKNTGSNIIRTLSETTSIRKGKYGLYVYYKTPEMNRPRFISMKGVSESEVTLSWVEARLTDRND